MSADRYSRQSFLGKHAETLIRTCVVGVVGLGGGGSHITQQLVHIGFLHYVLYERGSPSFRVKPKESLESSSK